LIKEEVNNNYVDNEGIAEFFRLLLELPDNRQAETQETKQNNPLTPKLEKI